MIKKISDLNIFNNSILISKCVENSKSLMLDYLTCVAK